MWKRLGAMLFFKSFLGARSNGPNAGALSIVLCAQSSDVKFKVCCGYGLGVGLVGHIAFTRFLKLSLSLAS